MQSLRAMFIVLLSVALTLTLPGGYAQAAPIAFTCVWTGAVDNTWNTPGNWSLCNGNFPQAADTASISSVAPRPSPVLNGSTTITRLDINPTGVLVVVGGAKLTANIVNINGHFSGPGEIEVLNIFRWGGVEPVDWTSDYILDNGGKITIQSGAHGYINRSSDYHRITNFTLENHGIVDPADAAPYNFMYITMNNALIDNYGTFVINGTFLDLSNNSTIHNAPGGTLLATSGANVFTALLNDGVVNVSNTDLSICRGSTQTGEFKGTGSALVMFGTCFEGAIIPTTFTFTTTSKLTVPRIQFGQTGNVVNIHGTYGPIGTSSESHLYGTVTFHSDATINSFGDTLNAYGITTVNATAPVDQYDLNVGGYAGNFSYSGTINVWHKLECGGILSGGGLLRVKPGAVLRISKCKLDGKLLENQGEAWWIGDASSTIQGVSGAVLNNAGVFNIGSGVLITGTLSLQNHGKISKYYNSTTTIAVPFENSGSVEILQGKLVFTGDVTLPVTTTNTIRGTLQVGELVNNGTLTVDGTIDGDLTNHGTLNLEGAVTGDLVNDYRFSPGSSPGLAIVGGNFTQTGNGSLKIDLSKDGDIPITNPLPGIDFDQLQITGTASITGELYLVAGQTLEIESLAEFPFLKADGGVSGTFGSLYLDDMIDESLWHLLYRLNEIAVRINAFLFLPWLNR